MKRSCALSSWVSSFGAASPTQSRRRRLPIGTSRRATAAWIGPPRPPTSISRPSRPIPTAGISRSRRVLPREPPSRHDDLGSVLQLGVEAAYRLAEVLRLGAGVHAVAALFGEPLGSDRFQGSFNVFAGVDARGGFAELRFTTNIDPPAAAASRTRASGAEGVLTKRPRPNLRGSDGVEQRAPPQRPTERYPRTATEVARR